MQVVLMHALTFENGSLARRMWVKSSILRFRLCIINECVMNKLSKPYI